MKYDFEQDLELGHQYEDKFREFLISKGIHAEWIESAPTNIAFEDWDIKVTYPESRHHLYNIRDPTHTETYEIKRDRVIQRTNNVCIETHSTVEPYKAGWFLTTKADYLIIFDTEYSFITITMRDLRAKWFDCPQVWEKKEITQDSGRKTINWVCPVERIRHVRWELD